MHVQTFDVYEHIREVLSDPPTQQLHSPRKCGFYTKFSVSFVVFDVVSNYSELVVTDGVVTDSELPHLTCCDFDCTGFVFHYISAMIRSGE